MISSYFHGKVFTRQIVASACSSSLHLEALIAEITKGRQISVQEVVDRLAGLSGVRVHC